MADLYTIHRERLCSFEGFSELSRDELRVLIALISTDGLVHSAEELAERAQVSRPRASAALSLFSEYGIIALSDGRARVIDEFEKSPLSEVIDEDSAEDVAESIRDHSLADLIAECSSMMGRVSLNTREIKDITALVTQLALSEEYILALASHMKEKGKLTPQRLKDRCVRLVEKGIDTAEELDKYIRSSEQLGDAEWEFRHLFGIYNRNLTSNEKKYFRRWSEELGYSTEVVGEAFNIAMDVNREKLSFAYINKILERWSEAGLKTAAECRAFFEKEGLERVKARSSTRPTADNKAEPVSRPKFTDFDTEDALARALARSYGDTDN